MPEELLAPVARHVLADGRGLVLVGVHREGDRVPARLDAAADR